jgi:hypothetical protein
MEKILSEIDERPHHHKIFVPEQKSYQDLPIVSRNMEPFAVTNKAGSIWIDAGEMPAHNDAIYCTKAGLND